MFQRITCDIVRTNKDGREIEFRWTSPFTFSAFENGADITSEFIQGAEMKDEDVEKADRYCTAHKVQEKLEGVAA